MGELTANCVEMVEKWQTSANTEIEIRVRPKTGSWSKEGFNHILARLNETKGLENKRQTTIDAHYQLSNGQVMRRSVRGDGTEIGKIVKTKIESKDYSILDGTVRLSLSSEEPYVAAPSVICEKTPFLVRAKNRTSFLGLFYCVDCTMVHSGSSLDEAMTNTPTFEIEIELVRLTKETSKTLETEDLAKELVGAAASVLKTLAEVPSESLSKSRKRARPETLKERKIKQKNENKKTPAKHKDEDKETTGKHGDEELRRMVCTLVGKTNTQLPGPLPANISRASLKTLASVWNQYWVCEKSDGERAMLLVTRRAGLAGAYWVDRRFSFTRLENEKDYLATLAPNGDTLLDGEMVEDLSFASTAESKKQRRFMVFDAAVVNGVSVVNNIFHSTRDDLRLTSRWRAFAGLLANTPTLTPVPVLAKKFYHVSFLSYLIARIKKVADRDEWRYSDDKMGICNRNDGIIFTPEQGGYLCQHLAMPLLKFKWPELITVDFAIFAPFFSKSGELVLHVAGSGSGSGVGSSELIPVRSIPLTLAERASIEGELKVKDKTNSGAIVECGYDARGEGKWHIKRYRWDKDRPNHVKIAFLTLESIAENITIDEIVNMLKPGVS